MVSFYYTIMLSDLLVLIRVVLAADVELKLLAALRAKDVALVERLFVEADLLAAGGAGHVVDDNKIRQCL